MEVGRYRWRHEAEMARGVLEDEGIPATVIADDAGGAYAGIAPARLLVARGAASRAREILRSLEDDETGGESEGGSA